MSIENEQENLDTTAVEDEEQEGTESTADEGAEGTDAPPEPENERTFTQDEVNDIVQRRIVKEQRRIGRQAQLEAENRVLREQVQGKAAPAEEPAPTLEQFEGDYDKYVAATVDYQVKQALRKSEDGRTQQQEQQQRQEKVSQFAKSGGEKYDDFQEAVFDDSNAVSPVMGDYFMADEKGVDVAYYLANNQTEARRIAQLPQIQQLRALDALAAKLNEPPKPSAAPEPIRPSKQTASTAKALTEVDDLDEFNKRRREQIKQRRR